MPDVIELALPCTTCGQIATRLNVPAPERAPELLEKIEQPILKTILAPMVSRVLAVFSNWERAGGDLSRDLAPLAAKMLHVRCGECHHGGPAQLPMEQLREAIAAHLPTAEIRETWWRVLVSVPTHGDQVNRTRVLDATYHVRTPQEAIAAALLDLVGAAAAHELLAPDSYRFDVESATAPAPYAAEDEAPAVAS